MITKIENMVFINSYGEQINLNDEVRTVLLSIDSVSGLEAEFATSKYPEQIGATVNALNIEPKLISLECALLSSGLKEEQRLRSELQAVLNPLSGKGRLIYKNTVCERETDAYVKMSPKFDDSDPLRPVGILNFQVIFYLAMPLWEDKEDIKLNLREVTPNFEFELEIIDDGIEISLLSDGEANIYNDGNAPVPLYFKFYGPAKNPRLIMNNEKYIKIKDELLSNEYMYISTKQGDKKVLIYRSDGTVENAWNKIDFNSTEFFQLSLGNSFISFDADTGSDDAIIEISYRKKYIGM